jgi:hypothetical protein
MYGNDSNTIVLTIIVAAMIVYFHGILPAKYLISKSVYCNITDLRLASEEDLWEEYRN